MAHVIFPGSSPLMQAYSNGRDENNQALWRVIYQIMMFQVTILQRRVIILLTKIGTFS